MPRNRIGTYIPIRFRCYSPHYTVMIYRYFRNSKKINVLIYPEKRTATSTRTNSTDMTYLTRTLSQPSRGNGA